MALTALTCLTWMFVLHIAAASCGTFEFNQYLSEALASKEGSRRVGVDLSSQIQQLSDSYTPHQAPKQHGPPGLCQALYENDFRPISATGYISAIAMTNLTYAGRSNREANGRIVTLALQQLNWKKITGFGPAANFATWIPSKKIPESYGCCRPNTSCTVLFTPKFSCVVGTLRDCGADGKQALESEGRSVTVCMPYIGLRPFLTGLQTRPFGFIKLTNVSEDYARRNPKNPALRKLKEPEYLQRAGCACNIAPSIFFTALLAILTAFLGSNP